MLRQLPDLLFVEVSERVDRARVVSENRRVAKKDLGLVRRPDDDRGENATPYRNRSKDGEVWGSALSRYLELAAIFPAETRNGS